FHVTGVQTCALPILRPNTERPITCTQGTNRLVLPQRGAILAAAERALALRSPARPLIERWDGHAAERIARVVCDDESFDLNEGRAEERRGGKEGGAG